MDTSVLTTYAEALLQKRGMEQRTMDPEVYEVLRANLVSDMEAAVQRHILSAMSPEAATLLTHMLHEGASSDEIDAYIQHSVPNLHDVITEALLHFATA